MAVSVLPDSWTCNANSPTVPVCGSSYDTCSVGSLPAGFANPGSSTIVCAPGNYSYVTGGCSSSSGCPYCPVWTQPGSWNTNGGSCNWVASTTSTTTTTATSTSTTTTTSQPGYGSVTCSEISSGSADTCQVLSYTCYGGPDYKAACGDRGFGSCQGYGPATYTQDSGITTIVYCPGGSSRFLATARPTPLAAPRSRPHPRTRASGCLHSGLFQPIRARPSS